MRAAALTALLLALVPAAGAGQRAASPARIVYSSDWTGHTEIFSLDPGKTGSVGQVTSGSESCSDGLRACGFAFPVPSPDGRRVACLTASGRGLPALWVAQADGREARRAGDQIILNADEPATVAVAWSPDSKRVAYVSQTGLHVARADGSGDRIVRRKVPRPARTPVWTADGRRITLARPFTSPDARWFVTRVDGNRGVVALIVTGSNGEAYRLQADTVPAWSRDGRLLAFSSLGGIRALDVKTGRTRRLTRDRGFALAWSPDGESLAYVEGTIDNRGYAESGDLRTITRAGRVSTVVDSDRAYGGAIVSLSWSRSVASIRYRAPDPAPAERSSPEGLLAGWPVERLAADGERIAYVACGQVFVWSPSGARPAPADEVASLGEKCYSDSYYGNFAPYSLALAGDRVEVGQAGGGKVRFWTLLSKNLTTGVTITLAKGNATNAGPFGSVDGEAAGSGDLLVFSSWKERSAGGMCVDWPCIVTTEQTVHRVDAGPCPCPALRTDPGPLVPFDVDGGRIVAGGDLAVVVFDREGAQRLLVPIRAAAAALSGSDLVVTVRGELRHYDAADGKLLHAWPLPDVPTGHECNTPATFRCLEIRGRLVLENAARGLAAYLLDGQLHLLRLSDGTDRLVAPASAVRFMDAGLVYADGTRIHVVPFDQLIR